jgi:O-succinylbenzoic acid--CoA ligase
VGGFGVVARAYASHCRFTTMPDRWHAESCVSWLEKNQVSHLSLVPTQLHDLVSKNIRCPDSVQIVIVGGGRLEPSLAMAAQKLGWPILASYGMTEAGSQIATQDPKTLNQPFSLDPLPVLPHWHVRIDAGGIIAIAGPALFHGELHRVGDGWRYQQREGEWYQTQDCGVLFDQRLLVTHRADSLVKVLGELVNPAAIEATLCDIGLPYGKFAVLPVVDDRQQNRLIFVHENLTNEIIASALDDYHQTCPGYHLMSVSICVADFPRSALGKFLHQDLIRIMDR